MKNTEFVVLVIVLTLLVSGITGLSQNSIDLGVTLSQPLNSTNWELKAGYSQYGGLDFTKFGIYQKKLNLLVKGKEHTYNDLGIGVGSLYSSPVVFATIGSKKEGIGSLSLTYFADLTLSKLTGQSFNGRAFNIHLNGFKVTKREGAILNINKMFEVKLGLRQVWNNFLDEELPINILIGMEIKEDQKLKYDWSSKRGLFTESLSYSFMKSPVIEAVYKLNNTKLVGGVRLGEQPQLRLSIQKGLSW